MVFRVNHIFRDATKTFGANGVHLHSVIEKAVRCESPASATGGNGQPTAQDNEQDNEPDNEQDNEQDNEPDNEPSDIPYFRVARRIHRALFRRKLGSDCESG
jgi:hypothetical protein